MTEYPIIGQGKRGAYSLTDVDVLGVRFPNAQHWISSRGDRGFGLENDPLLDIEPPATAHPWVWIRGLGD